MIQTIAVFLDVDDFEDLMETAKPHRRPRFSRWIRTDLVQVSLDEWLVQGCLDAIKDIPRSPLSVTKQKPRSRRRVSNIRRVCVACGGPLVSIGYQRANGRTSSAGTFRGWDGNDWSGRKLHKVCYAKMHL